MKICITLMLVCIGYQSALAQAKFSVPNPNFDFGKLHQNDRAECWFTVVNTGNEPLIIKSLMTTCGCDMPMNWKQEPIMPGDSTQVGYKYDSKRVGPFFKTMSMVTNASEERFIFHIKGEVIFTKEEEGK